MNEDFSNGCPICGKPSGVYEVSGLVCRACTAGDPVRLDQQARIENYFINNANGEHSTAQLVDMALAYFLGVPESDVRAAMMRCLSSGRLVQGEEWKLSRAEDRNMSEDPYRKEAQEPVNKPNWFTPGMYTVRIKNTRAILNRMNRTYCIVECELLEKRTPNDDMVVGETYTVLYNLDGPMGVERAGELIVVLDSEVPIGRPGEFLGRDDVIEIYNKAPFNGRIIDVVCREVRTKMDKPFFVYSWRISRPRLGQTVYYTESDSSLSVRAAFVSEIHEGNRVTLHILRPLGVAVGRAVRGFGQSGVKENAGKWVW